MLGELDVIEVLNQLVFRFGTREQLAPTPWNQHRGKKMNESGGKGGRGGEGEERGSGRVIPRLATAQVAVATMEDRAAYLRSS